MRNDASPPMFSSSPGKCSLPHSRAKFALLRRSFSRRQLRRSVAIGLPARNEAVRPAWPDFSTGHPIANQAGPGGPQTSRVDRAVRREHRTGLVLREIPAVDNDWLHGLHPPVDVGPLNSLCPARFTLVINADEPRTRASNRVHGERRRNRMKERASLAWNVAGFGPFDARSCLFNSHKRTRKYELISIQIKRGPPR